MSRSTDHDTIGQRSSSSIAAKSVSASPKRNALVDPSTDGELAAGALGALSLPVLNSSTESVEVRDLSEVPSASKSAPTELVEILSKKEGREYWRSLEEWAETPAFEEYVAREYPSQMEVLIDPVSRRGFLKIMGASMALAGFSACVRQPTEEIIPYVKQPENYVPGKSLYFATAMPQDGYGIGLLARSVDGRPVKIEGNPDHPASLGSTDIFAQASILGLYDPDRSKAVRHLGEPSSWTSFVSEMTAIAESMKSKQGAGLRILSENTTSPTTIAQARKILSSFPSAKWYQYQESDGAASLAGSQAAFGQPTHAVYNFAKAKRILSFESDFLCTGPGSVRYARDFAQLRRVTATSTDMSRFYAIESTPTSTGANADHRYIVRPSEMESVAAAIAKGVSAVVGGVTPSSEHGEWIGSITKDLLAHKGEVLVVVGEEMPYTVHAIAHAINGALNASGRTVSYTNPIEGIPGALKGRIGELVQEMNTEGTVEVLVILGGNPAATLPGDLKFADALNKVATRVHLSSYFDETSYLSHWHIPESHFLESWGDVRAFDGTASIIQPLIAPLYASKTVNEVLALWSGDIGKEGYELVRATWAGFGGMSADKSWRKAVHDGVIPGTGVMPSGGANSASVSFSNQPTASTQAGYEILFRLDPTIRDGRYSNNGWLQELPKPVTKVTWDNVIMLSPNTAKKLNVVFHESGHGGDYECEILEISHAGGKVSGPVWVMPGQADDTITVHLGYGREKAGAVGNGVGFGVNAIRTANAPWYSTGAELRATGETFLVACTQAHFTMEGRPLAQRATLEEYRKEPKFAQEASEEPAQEMSLYPQYEYNGHKWGMAIDLNSCTGCSACIVACNSENNIPVVGKDQVRRGREMHWLRVDRYFSGEPNNPSVHFQPLPCMHCEDAPCELVCPVGATVHSPEGINDMIYNRCVGTRYCSNNCPYKVRRFNFLLYQDWSTESLKMMRNPDVTVRQRGVMEKCTYCIQRVQSAKIQAENTGRPIRDGEIVTACQAACPTESIIFGDLNDANSRVVEMKKSERNYALVAEVNTRPRTTYLASITNPNPELTNEAKHA